MHAFAGGQTVGFDNNWELKLFGQRFACGFGGVASDKARRRDRVSCGELLGKEFAAFKPRGGRGWAYETKPSSVKCFGYSSHERSFGADDR